MHNITIFDIETYTLPEQQIRAMLPAFQSDKVKLGNAKKPELVAEIIETARMEHGNDEVARAALNPLYSTMAVAGFLNGEKVTQYHDMTEFAMIEASFAHILGVFDRGGIVAGYGIKFFDVIYLVKRAWLLGIKVPARIFNQFRPKYPFSESLLCLQEVWLAGSGLPFGTRVSLATVLRDLGLPPKTGSGSDFGALWAADKGAALAYNANDLAVENAVAGRIL